MIVSKNIFYLIQVNFYQKILKFVKILFFFEAIGHVECIGHMEFNCSVFVEEYYESINIDIHEWSVDLCD